MKHDNGADVRFIQILPNASSREEVNGLETPLPMHYASSMTTTDATYDEIEDAILHLPVPDRSRLATRILESIEEDQEGITPAWREEIERRARDIDEGRSVPLPAKKVWERVNDRFGTDL